MSPPETTHNGNTLCPGEELLTINDAPCITYFRRAGGGGGGDDSSSSRPLVVLIPGAAHLARVFYGGHKGHDERDFLSYWLTTQRQQSYNFLAVSYPLETDPATMPATDPGMNVSGWGEQAVEATRRTIRRHDLGDTVILAFWSMGGKILQPFCAAAEKTNIKISFVVPLVATPAVRGIRDRPILSPNPTTGYATLSARGLSESYFMTQLHEQNVLHDDKVIIPDEIYRRQYLGGFPVGLGCYGVRWSDDEEGGGGGHSFLDDADIGYEVADRFPLGKLPLICSISCSSSIDLRHSVADKYTWGFLLTYKLLGVISTTKNFASRRQTGADREKGRRLTQFIHSAPETLSATVEGGHHFFIGEQGAKRTAELIKDFETRVHKFQRDLEELLA